MGQRERSRRPTIKRVDEFPAWTALPSHVLAAVVAVTGRGVSALPVVLFRVHREVMPWVEHRSHKGLNSRAENSHQPTRQRERAMKGFRSVGGQQFLAAFSSISPHFRHRRHMMTATEYRAETTTRFAIWDQVTGVAGLPAAA